MGYIPPPPPPAWVEVTSLCDSQPRFIPKYPPGPGHRCLRGTPEESPQSRMARLAELERITKREAAIGAVLFLMLPVALLACLLQWAGVL